jgi:hypothetical protein
VVRFGISEVKFLGTAIRIAVILLHTWLIVVLCRHISGALFVR